MKTILTIAGFDPSSGAGITRDLDTFFSLGIHGASVPTSFVIQGPLGVKSIEPVPLEQFSDMVEAVTETIPIDGMKLGVLCNSSFIGPIATLKERFPKTPFIIDTVFAAKNGTSLITEDGKRLLIEKLFPLADIITPNIDEASAITGKRADSLDEMKESAMALCSLGPRAVVLKGGHLEGNPVDVLYDGKEFTLFARNRIERTVHGTGCSFSSLLVSFLTLGYPVREAFNATEVRMSRGLSASYRFGNTGYHYLSTGLINAGDAGRETVLQTLRQAKKRLTLLNMVDFVPEVQMNMVYATDTARGIEDVAAFPGRIGKHAGRLLFKGDPEFGSSSWTAQFLLAYMIRFPFIRSCINLKYSEGLIEKAKHADFCIEYFDWHDNTIQIESQKDDGPGFLAEKIMKNTDSPPDIIYDTGSIGKEPIIRLFGRDPIELIEKMEKIRL